MPISSSTVAVIGAGNVGATAAFLIARGGINVRLMDIVDGLAEGKALDMCQALALEGSEATVSGSTGFAAIKGVDLVVVTAGLARRPGMSRSDLLQKNATIVSGLAAEIRAAAPAAKVIVVTNPLDVMTKVMLRDTGFPGERVIGMGGVLDSGRMRHFLAQAAGVSAPQVECVVIGAHGDQMLPLTRLATVSGKLAAELLGSEALAAVAARTRGGGAEIVSLLKTGSAYFAPGAAINLMVRAIIFDEQRLVPCCVSLNGRYGLSDICLGAPARLGAGGVEEIVELPLSPEESGLLLESAEAVRRDLEAL